jgi:hypothetical protein
MSESVAVRQPPGGPDRGNVRQALTGRSLNLALATRTARTCLFAVLSGALDVNRAPGQREQLICLLRPAPSQLVPGPLTREPCGCEWPGRPGRHRTTRPLAQQMPGGRAGLRASGPAAPAAVPGSHAHSDTFPSRAYALCQLNLGPAVSVHAMRLAAGHAGRCSTPTAWLAATATRRALTLDRLKDRPRRSSHRGSRRQGVIACRRAMRC